MVGKMERGALSTSLLALFGLLTAQFFVGMALNLLVATPVTTFRSNASSFPDAIAYAVTGGNLLLTSHFLIDMGTIAVGIINLVLVIHKSNFYFLWNGWQLHISVYSVFCNGHVNVL